MKATFLYDQGSADIMEDGLIFFPPCFFGVTDGTSAVSAPGKKKKLFDEKTGGQLVSQTICNAFGVAPSIHLLDRTLKRTNVKLRTALVKHGVDINDSALAPAACFAVIKINRLAVDIIQGGDCLVVWEYKDGRADALAHQNYECERFLVNTIRTLMEKYDGNRLKMQKELYPILKKKRRKTYNKPGGICMFNGQNVFSKFWQAKTLIKSGLKTIIIFSDGFVPLSWTENSKMLAKKVIEHHEQGGLKNVLLKTRKLAKEEKNQTHEYYPEATAIAVNF